MGKKEWMKPKYASPVACLAKTSKLIRSLRDDEKVKSEEPGMCRCLRVHDESAWSLISSLICRFGAPYEESAMFRDGNFDQSV